MRTLKWLVIIVAAVIVLFWAAQRAVAADDDFSTSPNDPGVPSGEVSASGVDDPNDYAYDYDQSTLGVFEGDTYQWGANDVVMHVDDSTPEYDAAKNQSCRTSRWVAWHNGTFGRFATFHFNQHFCWGRRNGDPRVLDVDRPNISCNTTVSAEAVGWHCDGVSDKYGHYCRWRGAWHGCHVSARVAEVTGCIPEPLGCLNLNHFHFPMRLVLHGDGTDRFGLKF